MNSDEHETTADNSTPTSIFEEFFHEKTKTFVAGSENSDNNY